MPFPELLFLKSLLYPLRWTYGIITNQTYIEISIPETENWLPNIIPVADAGNRAGRALFSISTRSPRPVELTGINVDYDGQVQLLDPGDRGFFISNVSTNQDFPFRLSWKGSVVLRSDLQQAFVLGAVFQNGVEQGRIRISVYSRGMYKAVGNFEHYGRTKITEMVFNIRLTTQAIYGIKVPPKCGFSSPQPFLIESELIASGGPGPVIVHELTKDGKASSKRVTL